MGEWSAENRAAMAPGLPVPLQTAGPKPSLARSTTDASFVSQLLSGSRAVLPVRRQGIAEGAIGIYTRSARMAVPRMPAGYRKSILA